MKERGIIFNGEMVRAVLDGVKTQTRRPLKVQPPSDEYELLNIMSSTERSREGKSHWAILNDSKTNVLKSDERYFACPFGQVGDRIWVRETFGMEIKSLGGTPHEQLVYKTDKPDAVRCYDSNGRETPMKWKPSIHMPRWASRITLEITNIRVERVQDISEQDAMAEIATTPLDKRYVVQEEFKLLWQSIYGNWDENPWVWVIEFKRIDTEQESNQ